MAPAHAETKQEPTAVPHLAVTDLFKVSADMPAADLEVLTEYLSSFAKPTNADSKFACINCHEVMDGYMQAFGFGAAYRWGLTHGEANCSGCGWPARGMHYITGKDGSEVLSLRNVFLPYHPDFVEQRAAKAEGR